MFASIVSALAFLTSATSLAVSILTYRTAGPKVGSAGHLFTFFPGEVWLQIRIVNSGKGEIDIDGATCDVLGSTSTVFPYRLKAAASYVVVFRRRLPIEGWHSGSATVSIGFGNGRNLIYQVRMTEKEQAVLRNLQSSIAPPRLWRAPSQDEL